MRQPCSHFEEDRFTIRNEIDKLILEAETTHVCTTLQEKPKRLPVELKPLLAPFLKPVHP